MSVRCRNKNNLILESVFITSRFSGKILVILMAEIKRASFLLYIPAKVLNGIQTRVLLTSAERSCMQRTVLVVKMTCILTQCLNCKVKKEAVFI